MRDDPWRTGVGASGCFNILFRLIDTAGIREATDVIEQIGVARTFEKIATASVLLYLFDAETGKALA